MLPQLALATEIADHHDARGDADADRERLASPRFKPGDGFDDVEPGAYGSLGVVLVSTGIAKIGHNPVATEIRQKTVIGERDARTGSVVGVDHGAHVLRIEPGGERRRTDQIADHYRKVTAFGTLCIWGIRLCGGARRARSPYRADCFHQALPVA